jgi:hypothetical protein
MKKALLSLIMIALSARAAMPQEAVYKNPGRSIPDRIQDLLRRMTIVKAVVGCYAYKDEAFNDAWRAVGGLKG